MFAQLIMWNELCFAMDLGLKEEEVGSVILLNLAQSPKDMTLPVHASLSLHTHKHRGVMGYNLGGCNSEMRCAVVRQHGEFPGYVISERQMLPPKIITYANTHRHTKDNSLHRQECMNTLNPCTMTGQSKIALLTKIRDE